MMHSNIKAKSIVIFLIILLISNYYIPKENVSASGLNSYNVSNDWRWIPTSSTGDSTITTALSNKVDSGSVSISTNQTKEIILSLDPASDGGIFTYNLIGADQDAWTINATSLLIVVMDQMVLGLV